MSCFGPVVIVCRRFGVALCVAAIVQVASVTMPPALLRQYLTGLISSLVIWSGDSRNRFRLKVQPPSKPPLLTPQPSALDPRLCAFLEWL